MISGDSAPVRYWEWQMYMPGGLDTPTLERALRDNLPYGNAFAVLPRYASPHDSSSDVTYL